MKDREDGAQYHLPNKMRVQFCCSIKELRKGRTVAWAEVSAVLSDYVLDSRKTLPIAALLGVETTVFILSALLFNSLHYGKLPEDKFQILLHLSLAGLGRSSLMYQTVVHSLSVCSPELCLPFTSLCSLFGMASTIPTPIPFLGISMDVRH